MKDYTFVQTIVSKILVWQEDSFCKSYVAPVANASLHRCIISTASGALVVGGVRDRWIPSTHPPEIALSVQWSRTNQSVAVCGSLW